MEKIAIIGAGFGGMAAAYDLAKAGHKVTIYEAAETVGGLKGERCKAKGERHAR